MPDYTERATCRLCDSDQLTRVLDLGETALANELGGTELFPLAMNRCDACTHHQLSIAVKPERLWGPSYPYQSGTSPVWRKHLEELADEVAGLCRGKRVLEIASNDGTLVNMLIEREVYAMGVDPSGPDGGHCFRASWPWESLFTHPELNQHCIIALHVFAHVDDLHSFTAAVKEALAPGGVFIVEVGYLVDVVDSGHFDTIYAEHFSYHTVRPLAKFFERHGLRISDVKHVAAQGGSIRLYVKHADECEWFDAKDEEVPDVESLADLIRDRGEALREGFRKLEIRGERVAIFGAPAKLVTFLAATGLDRFKFDCVAEENPRKIGQKTPGTLIPIVSVEEMLERRPDTVVVAAHNFFDDMRDRLRRLGYSGGIINPMGRVE